LNVGRDLLVSDRRRSEVDGDSETAGQSHGDSETAGQSHGDSETAGQSRFQEIDWSEWEPSRSWRSPRVLVGILAALGLLAVWYSVETTNVDPLLRWKPTPLTWFYRASLLAMIVLVGPSLLQSPDRVRQLLGRIARDRVTLLAAIYLAVVTLAAIVGPIVLGRPRVDPLVSTQPPPGFEVYYGNVTTDCVGEVVGEDPQDFCRGTFQHPLGTTSVGYDVVELVVSGLHVSLQVAVITLAVIVPVGTAVGTLAGYFGGRVDTVLMSYVDIQQSTPAFVVYILLAFAFTGNLFLLVTVFGLLNWGGTARLVRAETLQRRADGYVHAARAAGAGHLTILRRHLLPNVSSSVLVSATRKVPQLILLEVGLTYIGLGDVGRRFQSFGETIRVGLSQHGWWIWLFPLVVLALTVISISLVGDALRDAVDPRDGS
jgi:peptide/nickel transport system permease protein